jgi:hypothetical protein
MNRAEVNAFVDNWLRAWNDHDLEGVLGHFSDDVVFASPLATQLLADSDGVLRGKAALREYWAEGLRLIPDLRFDVVGVYLGVGVLVINYKNQKGGLVNEVLVFDGDLVDKGYGTYLSNGSDLAGAGHNR